MTQLFDDAGTVIPVTVVEAGPCPVVAVKTVDSDGYAAVVLGFDRITKKRVDASVKGTFAKAKQAPHKVLREFDATDEGRMPEPGQVIDASLFRVGSRVRVTGTTKGKGFQGVVKRHGFGGGKATHGSMFHRAPGSIGQCAFPAETFPGKRLPGQMGNVRMTERGHQVVRVDVEQNLLFIKGAVPGPTGGLVLVRQQ